MTEHTDRQLAFVDHYLECLNGAEAARRAGYAEESARQEAWRLLRHPDIRALIDTRIAERVMAADEVLARVSDLAQTDITDYLAIDLVGQLIGFRFDGDRPLRRIKKITVTDKGEAGRSVALEVYDPQQSLALLGKHHKLFTDRKEISGPNGGPIEAVAWTLDDWKAQAAERMAVAEATFAALDDDQVVDQP